MKNGLMKGILTAAAFAAYISGCGGGGGGDTQQASVPDAAPITMPPPASGVVTPADGTQTDSPATTPSTTPSTPPANTAQVSVSSITPDGLMYGTQTTFVVRGERLDGSIAVTAAGCSNLNALGDGSASVRIYSCTPSTTGTIPVKVSASDGTPLASATWQIPAPQVTMTTSLGNMVIELYPDKAPVTVTNFLQYVNDRFYDTLIFHRVIQDFVIQGGGFNSTLQQMATRDPIKLEMPNGLSNVRGTIAMARTSALNSATSQFFINTVDNSFLDTGGGGYAVFGKVATGLDVVDKIAAVETQTAQNGLADVPKTQVVIQSVRQTR
jgi:cyclophilin family peptidyl-prolyl cis-trans isomerase